MIVHRRDRVGINVRVFRYARRTIVEELEGWVKAGAMVDIIGKGGC